jgi:predicted RNA-binding protein YlqC (UPF0109 family)
MNEKMKLTNDELSLMSLFEGLTDVFPIACKIYEDNVFFIVNKKDFHKLLASGFRMLLHKPGGRRNKLRPNHIISTLVSELGKTVGKNINITFYDGNLESFVRNFFRLSREDTVIIRESGDGSKIVTIIVDPGKRGKVIGRGGSKAKVGREFARAFFNVKTIIIK